MRRLEAADVMQSEVLTVNLDSSIFDAARIMLRHKVSGLPVIDWNRRLAGIVTEGDLLRRSEIGTERHRSRWLELLIGPGRGAAEYTTEHGHKISDVMTDRVFAVSADTPLAEIVTLMERNHIKRVPVVDGEKLIGIVSRADLLRVLIEVSAPTEAEPTGDAEIRERVVAEIDREQWSPRATINVEVKDGTVEFRGCITDDRERAALIVLAENVPGVKKVVDQLVWVEPLSGMVIEPPGREPDAAAPTAPPAR